MIGIIGAMEVELEELKKHVHNLTTETKSIRTFYIGTVHNQDVVIVQAGIGKVNAAVTTTLLLEHYDVDAVINIGVAGGQHDVSHKDVVISKEVLYHDVNVTNFGSYVHGQMPGHESLFKADTQLLSKTANILDELQISYKTGKIASGDQFVTSQNMITEINKLYNDIYAIEMEAAAIAHTCTIFDTPFVIYRSISDVLGDKNQANDFDDFLHEASKNAAEVLLKLLQVL